MAAAYRRGGPRRLWLAGGICLVAVELIALGNGWSSGSETPLWLTALVWFFRVALTMVMGVAGHRGVSLPVQLVLGTFVKVAGFIAADFVVYVIYVRFFTRMQMAVSRERLVGGWVPDLHPPSRWR